MSSILSIRHSTAIEPYVYEVGFSLHRLARRRYQNYIVYIRTMQVDILFAVIIGSIDTYLEVLIRVFGHYACLDRLVYLLDEFCHRADTYLFLSVVGTPYRSGVPQ